MRSAALPVPSQTTTGTGGVSVTYSRTARIVLVPPSITRLRMMMMMMWTVSEFNTHEGRFRVRGGGAKVLETCIALRVNA